MLRRLVSVSLILVFSGCDSGSTGHDASLDGRLPTDGAQPTCELEPCLNGGTCDDSSGTISCICAPGYEGDLCEVDIDDCADAPCQNDGVCVPPPHSALHALHSPHMGAFTEMVRMICSFKLNDKPVSTFWI